MTGLLQDVWHDLLDKRLWPIAVALLVGIVAIPVVLMRPAEQPSATPAASVTTVPDDPTDGVSLEVADLATGGAGSSLDTLREKNPFKPPSALMKNGEGKGSASASEAGANSGAGADGGTGGTPGGDTGGGGGGTAPGGTVTPPPPTLRTVAYEYVADVTFWNGDRRRQIKGLRKLDMLPDQSAPVLIFMGATKDGGNAVFLVDSTLQATGEGHCQPSDSNCTFVLVGPGSEHLFTTDEGNSYRLRVDEIRKVRLRAGTSSVGPAARTAVGSTAAVRAFALPGMADSIEETTVSTPSSPARDGR